MKNQIDALKDRIKTLELELKSLGSTFSTTKDQSISNHISAQFIADSRGNIYQYNDSFITKLSASDGDISAAGIVLNFQNQNQKVLKNHQISDDKTLLFAYSSSIKKEIKLQFKVQKLCQVKGNSYSYQFTEINNTKTTSHSDISELKAIKNKLEESEEKYRLLHQSSAFGVGYYSKEGIVLSYNDIAAKNMGGVSEDFEGKSFHEIFPKEQAEEYTKRFKHALEYNDSKEYIDHIKLPNASFWFKSIYTNIYNSKNELIGLQIISDDITENKLLENKLKTITNSIENSLNAYDIIDEKGNLIYVNKTYVKMWGYHSSDEIIGKPASEHCLDPKVPEKIIAEVNKKGIIQIEFIAKRKDGSTFDILMNISKDKDHNGDNIYTGTSLDISKSKKSQRDLIENEEKFRNFVDYTVDGIAIVDHLGSIVFVNKAFCGIFGIEIEETKNKYAWDLMSQMGDGIKKSASHKDKLKSNILALLSQKENIELEKNYTTIKQAHSKLERNIVETIFSFDTSTGKRLGIIVKDITEIKNAEKEIISTYKLLQDTEKISLSGSWTYDPINGTNHWSKGAYDLRGAPYESKPLTDIFSKHLHPNDFEEYFSKFNKNLKSDKSSFQQIFRIITEQNETKVISANYEVKRDDSGKPTLIIGIDKDITQIDKTEKLLQFQKRISQQYLEVAGVMFIALDTSQKVVLVNKKGCETLGYSEKEIIGKNWFDHFLPQENINIIKQIFNDSVNNNKSFTEYYENAIINKKGKHRIIAWYNSALRDEDGNIVRIVSSGTDITEQVTIQKALRESEETLRLALDSRKQGIYDLNIQTNQIKVNDSYAIMMGYDPKTFTEDYKRWINHLHPNDLDHVVKHYRDYIEGKIPTYRIEFRIKTKQGKWKWILSLGSIVEYTEDKKPLRMLGTYTDIDEIKSTQQALKHSEEKYRAMYNNAPLGYQSLDTNGNLIDVNPTWSDILGFEREEVLGKNFGDFLHPSQVPLFKERFPYFKAVGNVKDVQFKMIKKDGTNIDVSYEGCAGYTPEGEFKQTYCTFKDITAEVRAKEALIKAKESAEKSEHYSKTIAKLSKEIINSELSLDMIAKLIYNNSLLLTNSEFGYVTTIDPVNGDNIGHSLGDMMKDMCKVENGSVIFPKGPDGYPALWGHSLNTKKSFYTNAPTKHPHSHGLPKGHIQVKNFLSVPVIIREKLVGQIALANKSGGFSKGDLKIVEEIGNLYGLAIYRKHTESELITAKEQAEESDKLKSAFLANMSHEIRTPMNGIMGFAELLKEPDITADERDRFLGIIQKSGHRMLNIINDLIDISKIEAQQMEVFNEDTEINTQIEYLYTFFKPEAEKKNLELIYSTTLNDKDAVIFSDREKIYAILTNLIKNAIKYTKKGKIEFGYIKIENHLEFYVKDTGIGIQHSKLDSVFDRFVQADLSSATEYEGAGLGLAITKAYIELLGGNIWLDSEIDKGSTFTFTLPIKPLN